MQLNVVPKSGGNTFSAYFNTDYTNGSLQTNNLNDDLGARGLTTVTELKKVYDIGGGVGGPIMQDKLWFYTAHRWWGNQEFAPGSYYNATQGLAVLHAGSRAARRSRTSTSRDHTLRLTWQATPSSKVTVSYQQPAQLQLQSVPRVRGPRRPRARSTTRTTAICADAGHLECTRPPTGSCSRRARRILHNATAPLFQPEVGPNDIAITRSRRPASSYNAACRGILNASGHGRGHDYSQQNQRFSMSYITGSHAFKVGVMT